MGGFPTILVAGILFAGAQANPISNDGTVNLQGDRRRSLAIKKCPPSLLPFPKFSPLHIFSVGTWWHRDLPWGCQNGGTRKGPVSFCSCSKGWTGACCEDRIVPQCVRGMDDLCNELTEQSFSLDHIKGDDGKYAGPLTLGTADDNLPVQMQGVFWMTSLKGNDSMMVSFGQSRDGNDFSRWMSNGTISVRLAGDRVWAFTNKRNLWNTARDAQLSFDFKGNDPIDPTILNITAKIGADTVKIGADTIDPHWPLMSGITMTMTLINYPANSSEAVQYPANSSEAVQWELQDSDTVFTQIFDGNGNPTSAYNDRSWNDTTIYYHTAPDNAFLPIPI